MTGGGALRLEGLAKSYDDAAAVRGIDLDISAGEFFSLLGPSGCGKTTTLRMLAGFEQPTAGRILLDGADIARIPPHRRPVNTVFQNYALFPFLDVRENVAFGLRYQRATKEETRRRVGAALDLVQMQEYGTRRPAQLSGGQQQRVALARALVLDPSVLLLDEPLGALDALLRKRLQLELKAVQQRVGITFVYVTHDQEEALTMSDRLAVMRDGRVEQVGAPPEVYSQPRTAFVAGFLGSANVLDVHVVEPCATGGDGTAPRVGCRLGSVAFRAVGAAGTGPAKVVVRPERVLLARVDGAGTGASSAAATDGSFTGLVDHLVYHGPTTQVVVRLPDGQALLATVPNTTGSSEPWCVPGAPVRATLAGDAARLLPDAADVPVPAATAAAAEQRASAAPSG